MNKAFTLVELAIVIVIIGLLVGGVLQGQELIKQAELRRMMSNVEGYKAAFTGFYAKYNCLAGDCPNAYRFFADKDCGTNSAISSSNPTGCNGNGDALLYTAEGQKSMNHLTLSNLLKGSFTGAYTDNIIGDITLPTGAKNASIFMPIFSHNDIDSGTSCGYRFCPGFGGNVMQNVILYGSINYTPKDYPRGGLFTPREAYEIDVKFDDGIYYSGALSGENGTISDSTVPQCGDRTLKTYAVATTSTACRLAFRM